MTYEEMMSIGKSCGLTSVGDCYDNVMHHYDLFFKIDKLNEETLKLQKDICKKNPEEFMKVFSVSEDLVRQWNCNTLVCPSCNFEETLDDNYKEQFIGVFAPGINFGTTNGETCCLYACPKCKTIQMVTDKDYISVRKSMYKKQKSMQ